MGGQLPASGRYSTSIADFSGSAISKPNVLLPQLKLLWDCCTQHQIALDSLATPRAKALLCCSPKHKTTVAFFKFHCLTAMKYMRGQQEYCTN
mmetsp:Transcript_10611/g.16291  ORF Transcript_10611/g.16291 Transcript_10611/m.16291 type:complete len:93 (+) Transcript_10611:165-443(+)